MQYIDNQELRQQLEAFNIDPEQIKDIHLRIKSGEISPSSFIIPKELLRAPKDEDYGHYQDLDLDKYRKIGEAAIQRGELAVLWLNGGAATRYFDLTKVKPEERDKYNDELDALSPELTSLPKGVTPTINDLSYLELKIKNLIKVSKELKVENPINVILMNSFVTDQKTEEHLKELYKKYEGEISPEQFSKVVQRPLFPRFTKPSKIDEIDVFVDKTGSLSFAPSGHGDFLHLMQEFFKKQKWPGVKYLFFANIDNFGTTIRPEILGYHIEQGKGRTVELAAKLKGDKGGAPCFVNDSLEIVEQMKFPEDFDQDSIPTFNTNSFWLTIEDILNYKEELPLIMADKTVQDTDVIQLEHFACDINLDSAFLEVPRDKRFWPTKRYVDLLIYRENKAFQQLIAEEYGIN